MIVSVPPARPSRRGFSLLELLLTLALSVVLLGLIGGAFRFYGIEMVKADSENRQIHLATAVIQMIEDDLRSTLHNEPVDMAPLEAVLSSISGQSSGGGGSSTAGSGATTDPTTTDPDPAAADTLETDTSVLQSPGLIGNQYQIQIDISKLPRLEEYTAMLDENNADLRDPPSDIKTVAYFVQAADIVGGIQDTLTALDPTAATASGGGLVRRVLDRAVTEQASLTGGITQLNQTGDLLAPEVTGIEFSYWDGITWQIEWNSDELGELPLAVQVTLQVTDLAMLESADPLAAENATRTFVHTVRLPMARMIEEEEEELETSL